MLTIRKVINVDLGCGKSRIVGIELRCDAVTDTEIKFKCGGKCKECEHCGVMIHNMNNIIYSITFSDKLEKIFSNTIEHLTERMVFQYKFYNENQDMYFKFVEIGKMLGQYKAFNNMESDRESSEKYLDLQDRFENMFAPFCQQNFYL